MQQIADKVGVHVTTVSRAVDDKWIQTPRGIFPLKRFFGGGTTTAEGDEIAWDTIKQKLLEVIAKEDKLKPDVRRRNRRRDGPPGRQGRAPHRHQVPSKPDDPVEPPAKAVLNVTRAARAEAVLTARAPESQQAAQNRWHRVVAELAVHRQSSVGDRPLATDHSTLTSDHSPVHP